MVKLTTLVCVLYRAVTLLECFVKMFLYLYHNNNRCIHFGKVKQEAGKNINTTQTSMIVIINVKS